MRPIKTFPFEVFTCPAREPTHAILRCQTKKDRPRRAAGRHKSMLNRIYCTVKVALLFVFVPLAAPVTVTV